MECLRNAYCPYFSFAFFNWDKDEDEECEYDPVGECDGYSYEDEIVERNWTWKWDTDPVGEHNAHENGNGNPK